MRRVQNLIARIILILAPACVLLLLYANSFEDVERVCRNHDNSEVYLLNYVTKKNLKNSVYAHNKGYESNDNDVTRVYLLNYIFEIPDPVWDSKLDYKNDGCKSIDNMDIYCEVRYSELKNGEIDVWYNFME